ncbi:hypothetical protein C8J57DRAFT_1245506 [Mycena rebaudengoi]|nr:hypothetical protein C8J57DRAFT_1245506 [Mycena rebaudengoi]
MGATREETREETRETRMVTNVTVSHFGGNARKTSKNIAPVPPKREVFELVSENNGPVAGRILDEMIASSLSLAKRSWLITATLVHVLVEIQGWLSFFGESRPYALAANRSQVEFISILRKLEATPSLEPETILSRSLQVSTTWEGENALELELGASSARIWARCEYSPLLTARVPARPVYDPQHLPAAPFFKLNRQLEARKRYSRELEDSKGARWLGIGGWAGAKDVRANASICSHAAQIPLLWVGSSVLEVRDVVNVADVRENDSGVPEGDLLIDVDKNKAIGAGRCAGPTTARDARSGTWKDDVNYENINEGRVDDERAAFWVREISLHARSETLFHADLPDSRLARSFGCKQRVQGCK